MNTNLNTSCTDWQPLLIDVLFGDADDADKTRLEGHMAGCPGCAAEFSSLAATLEITADREKFEPGPGALEALEARILDQTVGAAPRLRTVPLRGPEGWQVQVWTRRAVAAAAVLLVGILIGRTFPEPPATPAGGGGGLAALSSAETRAYDYLDRSKTLLLGVVNFDASTEDPASLNLPQRSAIAGELLQEAGDLKNSLSESDEQRLKALVTELEIILLQLANLDERVEIPQIEVMQAGVDRNAILFKIDVEQMRRATPAPPAQGT